ncbi:hypothetical protein ACWCSH_16965 [Streptosporangium sp. NPDC001682]
MPKKSGPKPVKTRRTGRIASTYRGRLVEQGSHREPLAEGGAYARLYARQVDDLDQPTGRAST